MKDILRNLIKKGLFDILGANLLNRIIGFASSIVLVRILTKEEFGLYSYADNLVKFFLLFNALGVTAGILQFCSETRDSDKKYSYFKYGIRLGVLFNFFVSLLILFYGLLFPLKLENARFILISMFLLPMVSLLFEAIQMYFRATLQNRYFSLLSSLNTFLIFLCSILGAYFFQAIGVVLLKYIAYLISILVGVKLLKDFFQFIKAPKLLYNERKNFIKFSMVSSFNNAIAQLLYVIDIFLIGILIVDANEIASYKTATLIPFALNFIPLSIMTFIYPYFAKNHSNKKWIKDNYKKLTKYLLIINSVISIFLIIFAKFIIKLLFGSQYLDSVYIFQILAFGYFIAGTFRIPAGNILVMLKKLKFNFYLSIITGILNIVLGIILIYKFGAIGAAFSTILVFIFTSLLGSIYLNLVLRNEK